LYNYIMHKTGIYTVYIISIGLKPEITTAFITGRTQILCMFTSGWHRAWTKISNL